MHLFCNRVRIDRSRSSNVDDFNTNGQRIMQLPISLPW